MYLSISHWRCHCHIHDNRNTFKYAGIGLLTHPPVCTQNTHVMYALLKHIHRACWDLPMTNNRGVKCEVCICHVSILSACEVAVNEELRWRADIARPSRRTLPKLPVPKLSPPSPSIPIISTPFSGSSPSQQLPDPWKMNRTAESILNGQNLHTGLTNQGQGWKGFYQFSLLSLKQENQMKITH